MNFEQLRERLAGAFPPVELERIDRAYAFAARGHEGQQRADGSPYISHPVAVADILADLGLPSEVIEAGLLHDVVEDNDRIKLPAVRKEFGEEVASLVDGVTKLTELPRVSRAGERDEEELSEVDRAKLRQAENIRKTILAMNNDVRVVLIKLADRLHNMRTLGSLRPDKQKRVAAETLEIFAPLASRLGIWQLKWQLEDLSFRYLDPSRYREISRALAMRREERERTIKEIAEHLQKALAAHGIEAKATGRPKHIYSIYKKMDRKGVSLTQVYDVRAVRVFVETIPDCYSALGVVHNQWRPIPGEFDDYIAAPKENFYQSLHTAVVYDDGKTLEIQIRTFDMHRHAEYGIAAHWLYKEGGGKHDEHFERRISYLRSMLEWHKDVVEAPDFVDALKSEVLQDRVYVFTPRGDVVDLPYGSSPIDFAYHIHTEVGHRCRGARINGRMVPLSYHLRNGDQVEILTVNRGGPSRDWLNADLGYVTSARAREKIRAWFRRQDRQQHLAAGKAILERELKRLRINRWSADEVAQAHGFGSTDEFLARLGRGDVGIQAVVNRLVRKIRSESPEEEAHLPPPAAQPAPRELAADEVRVAGMAGMLTQIARCCHPVPGDPILGYTTRGRGIIVHREDCRNILRVRERERVIPVTWGGGAVETYAVPLRIEVFDRDGLLRDIANIVADEKISMRAVHVPPIHSHRAVVNVTLEVADLSQLMRLMNRIEQLPAVVRVYRTLEG